MKNAISLILSAALVVGAMPTIAFAQEPSHKLSPDERAKKVEELAGKGAGAYRKGEYDKAIDLFKQAYAIEPVPNLLYNIAKSYEKQDNYDQAVAYYQKFVVAPEVDSKARQAALERIDSLRQIAQMKKTKGEQGDEHTDKKKHKTAPKKEQSVDTPVNMAGVWTTVGGAALLAGGAVAGLVASSKADTVKNGSTYADRKSAQDSGKTDAMIADGLFVAGAAVTGVGLYLLFSGGEAKPQPAAAQAVVTPWVTTHSAGLGMSLDF